MPYNYEFINKLEQYDTVKYTLVITDSDGIMPSNYIPVLINSSENTEENLISIANNCINSCISDYNLSNTQIPTPAEIVNDISSLNNTTDILPPDNTTDIPVDINIINN